MFLNVLVPILVLLFIVAIFIGYYTDYKKDKKGFKITLFGTLKLLAGFALVMILIEVLKKLFL